MRKNILTLAAALLCSVAIAQNINPTVEVTNTYQGDPSEVHKPQIGMAIPDSLLRFDMDFGYEVFEKPYQGAFNFKPYMLDMTPEKNAYRGRKLYLKAGAGYSLHPQLDLVFSPENSGPFQMSVYAGHRSYFGKYNNLHPELDNGVYEIIKVPGKTFGGYDALSTAGFEGIYNFNKAIISFGVGYDGLMTKDTIASRSFNAGNFNLRVKSNRDDSRYIFYDIALNGCFGSDKRSSAGDNSVILTRTGSWSNLNESSFGLVGAVGPVFDATHAALLGFEAETLSYSGYISSNAGRLALIPKYRLTSGNLDLDLGVRVETVLKGKVAENSLFDPVHQYKGGMIFPDVKVRFGLTDNVSLYASATGGHTLNSWSSILTRNHFIMPEATGLAIMENSVEKVNAKVGLKGNVRSKLQFEVDGGAAVVGNGLLDGAHMTRWLVEYMSSSAHYPDAASHTFFSPTVVYSDYSLIYADALVDLVAGNFHLDGGLHFRHMALKDDTNPGLLLPKLSCDFKAVYDFSSRVYAGFRVQAAGARKGNSSWPTRTDDGLIVSCDPVTLPGWVDLGLLGGWRFNRKLGFWLESGNLLCETIQRTPFYSEKDLWITAGITLSL